MTEKQIGLSGVSAPDPASKIILDASPVGIVVFDHETRVIYANALAEQLLGKTVGAGITLKCSDFIVCADRHPHPQACGPIEKCAGCRICAAVSDVLDGQPIPGFVQGEGMVASDADPHLRWIKFKISGIESGLRRSAVMAIDDITSSKETERALRGSEDKYGRLFENSVVGIFQSNPQGQFTYVNSAFATMLGYDSPAQLISSINDIATQYYADSEDRRRYQQLLKARGFVEDFEFRAKRRDGSRLWVVNNTRAYFGKDGEVLHYEGVVIDITDRKKALESLQESEERFQKAFMASPAPLVIAEIDTGRFIDVNDRWAQMIGYSRDEQIGRTSIELRIWANDQDRDHYVRKLRDKGRFTDEPVVFKNKAGDTVNALWSAELITLSGRQVILGMLVDESERKRSEKERARLQKQLNQAQKMESVGRLAGGVAHDFNNMLSVIMGYTELALQKLHPDDPLYADLMGVYKAGKRSTDITRQLLAYARQQTIDPQVVDLNALVESMLRMLRRLIGEDIDLSWHPGRQLWSVRIDPAQVDQILANLIVNARDAIEGVGKVRIETDNVTFNEAHCHAHTDCSPGEFVLLAVGDDGCGMDEEVLDYIFEPFFTTKGVSEGTGLGLATVYGIVKQNEGFIHVHSKPEQGTTFNIYLPRHMGATVQKAASSAAKTPVSRGETVLLVEDEPTVLLMGQLMLEKLGYHVLTAGTPNQAMEQAKAHAGTIDLILTDVVMPEMNGRELAGRLSSLYPGLKTLYMSGYTADVIAHRGVLEAGMHFLQKPFSFSELGNKVRSILDAS